MRKIKSMHKKSTSSMTKYQSSNNNCLEQNNSEINGDNGHWCKKKTAKPMLEDKISFSFQLKNLDRSIRISSISYSTWPPKKAPKSLNNLNPTLISSIKLTFSKPSKESIFRPNLRNTNSQYKTGRIPFRSNLWVSSKSILNIGNIRKLTWLLWIILDRISSYSLKNV